MRWLKLAFISAIVFAILFYLLSLLFPSQVFVTRAININAPFKNILSKIDSLHNWKEWNPYAQTDSGQIATIVDKDGKEILVSEIKTESGSAKKSFYITAHHPNAVEYSLELSSHTETGDITISTNDSLICEVRWTQWKKAKYPWQKFSFFYQDKIYAPAFEKGLAELKEVCERE